MSYLTKKITALALLSLSGLCTTNLISAVIAEEWVPVYEEPQHRLAFENDHAMILDVFLPPGYVSLYHKHVIDVLYVTIVGTSVWAEPLGGEKRGADVKTGDLRFSSDNHGLPHIHRVGNVGTDPFHVIGVGIKDKAAGLDKAIEGDTTGLSTDIERPHASVYRIKLKPGEKSGVHTHKLPFTMVNLSAATLRDESGATESFEAGSFSWHDSGETHQYENAGEETIEIVEVQWR